MNFEDVTRIGLTMPGVEAGTQWDGAPVLRLRGCFMASLATHASAEPNSLIVRTTLPERELLLEDAPDTYYVNDYYRRHPVVLVRLANVDAGIVRELLQISWRLTEPKAPRRRVRAD